MLYLFVISPEIIELLTDRFQQKYEYSILNSHFMLVMFLLELQLSREAKILSRCDPETPNSSPF